EANIVPGPMAQEPISGIGNRTAARGTGLDPAVSTRNQHVAALAASDTHTSNAISDSTIADHRAVVRPGAAGRLLLVVDEIAGIAACRLVIEADVADKGNFFAIAIHGERGIPAAHSDNGVAGYGNGPARSIEQDPAEKIADPVDGVTGNRAV